MAESKPRFAKLMHDLNRLMGIDFPEPDPCKKCGRVIYCGVSKMCQEKNCELKSRQSLQAKI